MEKIVLNCLGKYFKEIGIEKVLVKNEVFGHVTVKQAMAGIHYVRSKCGMSIVAEAIYRLYFSAFHLSREDTKYNKLLNETNKIQAALDNNDELNDRVIQAR